MKNVYLFTGNEELIIKNKIDTIVNGANPGAFNLTSYDMENARIGDVINDCKTMPFMSDSKVVIMRHATFLSKNDNTQNVNPLLEYLDKPSDFTVLIIDATNIELDEKKNVVIKLRQKAEVSETRVLSDVEIRGWLKRQFGVLGIEIEESAIDLFLEYVGTNLVQAKTEVDKLVSYVGEKMHVDVKDVEACVSDEGETNVFALTKAIIANDKGKVLDIYYSLLKNGNDQIKLLNLIYRSFKDAYTTLLLIQKGYNQSQIATSLGVSQGRAYYIMKDAKNFDFEKLEENLVKISELDVNIKTGRIDKVSGMEIFLFGL